MVLFQTFYSVCACVRACVCVTSADPEGGQGGPDPLENHNLYGLL